MTRLTWSALVALFCLLVVASAQVPGVGRCPNLAVSDNFSLRKYMGKWYEIERYFAYFEFGKKCVTTNLTQQSDGSVLVTIQSTSKWTKSVKTRIGVAHPDVREPAKFVLQFKGPIFTKSSNYWVLDTDYTNYSVVWSCSNYLGIFHTQFAWILSRKRVLDEDTRIKIYSKLDKMGLSHSKFFLTDQANCSDNH
uniref:Apolipoprotein D n=1 Tax=Hemiscolopendra marginata TaxID=943146 RepID=A0A646QED8_9MYRI